MDAQKASYSIALMAEVLGVTRAGYYALESRAGQRAQRVVARRRLDEAVSSSMRSRAAPMGLPASAML